MEFTKDELNIIYWYMFNESNVIYFSPNENISIDNFSGNIVFEHTKNKRTYYKNIKLDNFLVKHEKFSKQIRLFFNFKED